MLQLYKQDTVLIYNTTTGDIFNHLFGDFSFFEITTHAHVMHKAEHLGDV